MTKILYICDQNPFLTDFGSQQRSGLILKALLTKAQVDLVCFASGTPSETGANPNCTIRHFGEIPRKSFTTSMSRLYKLTNIFFSFSPYSVYKKSRVAYDITRGLMRSFDYDYIVIRYMKNAFMCGLLKDQRIVVDMDDLPDQLILSYVNYHRMSWYRAFQYRFYAKRARIHMDRFIKGIHHVFCANSYECMWSNSSHLPNIPFPHMISDHKPVEHIHPEKELVVLFVGYFIHTPNKQGVQYFLDHIWEIVKESVPNAEFKIVGKGVQPDQKENWEKNSGVKVMGYVSDIRSEYRKCSAVVVPIYFGAGSNIKALEAMSMKKAVVISKFAAKPFKHHLIDNENIMIAEDNHDFAAKLIRLLVDVKRNQYIAENGAKVVAENYSYSSFESAVLHAIQ